MSNKILKEIKKEIEKLEKGYTVVIEDAGINIYNKDSDSNMITAMFIKDVIDITDKYNACMYVSKYFPTGQPKLRIYTT